MRLEDKASQASGSNRPKPSLLSRVKKDYMKARTLFGSIRAAWDHARKPNLYKAGQARKRTLAAKAKEHQRKVASGEIHHRTKK